MTSKLPGIPFAKANGCGNDFLIIERRHAPKDIASFTIAICNRRTGVGADGVEWVERGSGDCEVSARLINNDGSEAEISGNGTRCVAAYWIAEHGGESVRVRTGAGIKSCKLTSPVVAHNKFEFEMNMGVPKLGGKVSLALSTCAIEGMNVSMGNPHFVSIVSEFDPNWQELGEKVQAQPVFTSGTNVEFVRVLGEYEIESRFFERGVGETQSSGTGSCASAVAAIASGVVKSPVHVVAAGGRQQVRWDGAHSEVFLTGAAELICKGEFFI